MLDYLPVLKDLGQTTQLELFEENTSWKTSSASIQLQQDGSTYEVLVRCVNYQIGPEGWYCIQDPDGITCTENMLLNLWVSPEMAIEYQTIGYLQESNYVGVDRRGDNRTLGLEDARLLSPVLFSATSLEYHPEGNPQICLAIRNGMEINCVIPLASSDETTRHVHYHQTIEKNWLPFPHPGGDLCHFVYSLSPLRILELDLYKQTLAWRIP